MPVSQKIKAAGRTLIGVGTRKSTNRHWAKSCHEFRYYENLVEPVAEPVPMAEASASAEGGTSPPQEPAIPLDPAAELLRRAVRLLAETRGDPWVNKAEIWPMIKRLDSTFDLKENGHTSFSGMVKALESVVEVRKGEYDQQVRVK